MLCNIMEGGKKKCEQYWPEAINVDVSAHAQRVRRHTRCGSDADDTEWLSHPQDQEPAGVREDHHAQRHLCHGQGDYRTLLQATVTR